MTGEASAPNETNGAHPATQIQWRVSPRRWHYGYENGYENFGSALGEIRAELGFTGDDAYADFSNWLYEEGQRRYGEDLSVPPVLLEAFEFPALGWEQSVDVIESVAKVVGVSPGTLLDELWLRASRMNEDGTEVDED